MTLTTRVPAASVNDLYIGQFARLVRRTVRPSDEIEGMYDIELELQPLHEVEPERPDAPADDRPRWLVEPMA